MSPSAPYEDFLAEARRAVDGGQRVDVITANRLMKANGECLRALLSVLRPAPRPRLLTAPGLRRV